MDSTEDIAYKSDLGDVVTAPVAGASGNIAVFGPDGRTILDGQIAKTDVATLSALSSAVASEVDSATGDIEKSIRCEYAIGAYCSDAWASSTSYAEGDFCRHNGRGYRCLETHTSGGSMVSSYWEEVLEPDGIAAIDALLVRYSKDGLATVGDLAPEYDDEAEYKVGQLVDDGGTLKICTSAGEGPNATFSSDATVYDSIEQLVAALETSLSASIAKGVEAAGRDKIVIENGSVYACGPTGSETENDRIALATSSGVSGFAKEAAIDKAYDTSSSGYSPGDTCTFEGKWYRCIGDVSRLDPFDSSKWEETSVKEEIGLLPAKEQADWSETDITSQAYIRNKPEIATPFMIEELSAQNRGESYWLANNVTYVLKDRTVNVIRPRVGESENIRLVPPTPLASSFAREFIVVISPTLKESVASEYEEGSSSAGDDSGDSSGDSSGSDSGYDDGSGSDQSDGYDPNYGLDDVVPVLMTGSVSLVSYDGRTGPTSLYAIIGGSVTYKFVERGLGNNNVFLVTGFADPAYQIARDIDRALDYILEDGGAGIPGIAPAPYIYDEANGKYHKLTAVTDEDGEVNIGVEQNGVD